MAGLKESEKIIHIDENTLSVGKVKGIPNISNTKKSLKDISSYFLGPRAENQELLSNLITKSLNHIYDFRKDFLPGDPEVITNEIKQSDEYKSSVKDLEKNLDTLLEYFNNYATPFFSLRYQAHMLWDNTLPAIAGYFAAMLHNPNNVTMQASTSTTPLEIVLCKDLCYMLGFSDSEYKNKKVEPFAHLCSDGSLSVEEAVWATREMKFLPFAIKMAIEKSFNEEDKDYKKYRFLQCVKDIEVTVTNGKNVKLLEASNWELFNLQMNEILQLPSLILEIINEPLADDKKLGIFDIWNPIEDLNMNALGWHTFWPYCSGGDIKIPKMITPSTKHYSWPKSGSLIGIGWQGVENIVVDEYARMNLEVLKEFLDSCLETKTPLLTLTCVFGSTEESAVDPLDEILQIREDYRKKGLEFNIHVDGAWGGYLTSIIRAPYSFDEKPSKDEEIFIKDTSTLPLSQYVINQAKSIHKADSMTIDPHKYGYIQYPAGAIIYKNVDMRVLTTFSGSYIGGNGSVDPGDAPTVGCFGLEGSRPGASASAVFLSHMCIRPDTSGYGNIIKQSLWNARRFYLRLLFLETNNFVTITLTPEKEEFKDKEKIRKLFEEKIEGKSLKDISNDSNVLQLVKDVGPDQCIVDYTFNFKNKNGSINKDKDSFIKFNNEIYKMFSLPDQMIPEDIHEKQDDGEYKYPFFLTLTEFERSSYGDKFLNTFINRIGLDNAQEIDSMPCFRSVIMDPYVSDSVDGSYFKNIFNIMKNRIDELAKKYQS